MNGLINLPQLPRAPQRGLLVISLCRTSGIIHIRHPLGLADIQLQISLGRMEILPGGRRHKQNRTVGLLIPLHHVDAPFFPQRLSHVLRLLRGGLVMVPEAFRIDLSAIQLLCRQRQCLLMIL